MTARTFTATRTGPLTFDVRLTAGSIEVTVEDRDRAEVTIRANDGGPATDAVDRTDFNETRGRLTVRVPDPPGVVIGAAGGARSVRVAGAGVTVIQSGGAVVGSVVGAIVRGGDVIVGGGATLINGATVIAAGSAITVEARLPEGSCLAAETTSADVKVRGDLGDADVTTVSGDIRLGGVQHPQLCSTSGDVCIDRFAGEGRIKTVSGDIRITAAAPSTLRARSVSGDVRVAGAQVQLDARSVSGRVSTWCHGEAG